MKIRICKVKNIPSILFFTLFQVTKQFSLTVDTPSVALPTITQLRNESRHVGSAVELACHVTSQLTPDIQWLKKAEGDDYTISIGEL